MRETTRSKLRELWSIRRHCKEIQREQESIYSRQSSGSSATRRKTLFPGPIFASCFFAACFVHVRDMWLYGWLPYHSAPFPLNYFWTAVGVLDVSAAVLLIAKPRIGLVVSMFIMFTDVAVNAWVRFDLHLIRHTRSMILLFLQLSFLAVMSAVTAYTIGRRISLRVN